MSGQPMPHCPAPLHRLVEGERRAAAQRAQGALRQPAGYAAAALANEVDRLRNAIERTRNDCLNRAAYALGQLVGAQLLDRGLVERERGAAGHACGLVQAEAARTVRSGLTAGARNPRAR